MMNLRCKIMDTSDEWIQAHTGIKTRHYAIGEDSSENGNQGCGKTFTAGRMLRRKKLI